jgi:hypothetical protein
MPLKAELTRACVQGPAALQTLVHAKGMRLGAELNVLREVIRTIVLQGADPKILCVIAKQLKGLEIPSNGIFSDTVNALTELIRIESDLNVIYMPNVGYTPRQPDHIVRKSIDAAVQQALKLMPKFNIDQRINYSGNHIYIPTLALTQRAYYVYEALNLPLRPFADQVLFRGSYHTSKAIANDSLGRLVESAPFEELVYVHAGLRRFHDNPDYQTIRADLGRRIRPPLQLALFLAIYKPVFGNKKRTRRGCGVITEMSIFLPEMFHLIADMAFE